MTRQNLLPDPASREFEVFTDFSGGLNSEISNERLKDNEFPIFENVDLTGRGSGRRRTGRTQILALPAGTAQGGFFYYRKGQPSPDLILAIGGKLYVKHHDSNSYFEVANISFQTSQTIEGVQYKDTAYIATGTNLFKIRHNGTDWEGSAVTPYTPTVMEAIYIGTNGLADNPDGYVQDGTSGSLQVVGIKPAKRTGAVNQAMPMTAYISKPGVMGPIEYKWEYKKSVDTAWTTSQDFSGNENHKTWYFSANAAGNWDIRVTARDIGTPSVTAQYVLTNYQVNQVDDKSNVVLPTSGIKTCKKILLHWDRLILYGDDTNPYQIYISDLNNPAYFPVTNTISFDTGKQEPITTLTRFQNLLVVFTKTTIQTLVGKSPEDYQRYQIHDGIGCIAPWSAAVVGNTIIFRSFEGVQVLKPNPYRLETMNVSRVDLQVKSEIALDTESSAMVYDNQYWLCVPSQNRVYRYYYETGTWTVDKSSKLNLRQFLRYGDSVFNLAKTGQLYRHDSTVYTDAGEVYAMKIETKFLDFSAAFNNKKIRKLYVLARHFDDNVDLSVFVQADSAFVLSPEKGEVVITEDEYVEWKVTSTPNMHFLAPAIVGEWTLGSNPLGDAELSVQQTGVRGKCRRVKLRFEHKQDTPCEIYGFAFEFKLKKP